MHLIKHFGGHLSLLALGVLVLATASFISSEGATRYQQLAAGAEPSAAEQIWQIGNQPVGYLQTSPNAQLDTQINTQNVWGQTSAFDNIQIQSPSAGSYTGSFQQFQGTTQGDVWSQLDTQVQSSETQVANNPIQQSTFDNSGSGLGSLDQFNATFANPGMSQDAFMTPDASPSFWSDPLGASQSWFNGAESTVASWLGFGGGPSDSTTLGIRG